MNSGYATHLLYLFLGGKSDPKSQNYLVSLPTNSQGKLRVSLLLHTELLSQEKWQFPGKKKQLYNGFEAFSFPILLVPLIFSSTTCSLQVNKVRKIQAALEFAGLMLSYGYCCFGVLNIFENLLVKNISLVYSKQFNAPSDSGLGQLKKARFWVSDY